MAEQTDRNLGGMGRAAVSGPRLELLGDLSGRPPVMLARAVTLVGSRQIAHVRIASRQVSKAHALLVQSEGRFYLHDLASRTQTLVNGEAVAEADLKDKDQIQIGPFVFRFRQEKQTRQRPLRHKPMPAVLDVAGAEEPRELGQRVVLIGRRANCDVVLEEPSVSTAHAAIVQVNGRRLIFDLGSRSGTFVNGSQVSQLELTAGDVVRIGDTEIRYLAAGEETDTPAPREEADAAMLSPSGVTEDVGASVAEEPVPTSDQPESRAPVISEADAAAAMAAGSGALERALEDAEAADRLAAEQSALAGLEEVAGSGSIDRPLTAAGAGIVPEHAESPDAGAQEPATALELATDELTEEPGDAALATDAEEVQPAPPEPSESEPPELNLPEAPLEALPLELEEVPEPQQDLAPAPPAPPPPPVLKATMAAVKPPSSKTQETPIDLEDDPDVSGSGDTLPILPPRAQIRTLPPVLSDQIVDVFEEAGTEDTALTPPGEAPLEPAPLPVDWDASTPVTADDGEQRLPESVAAVDESELTVVAEFSAQPVDGAQHDEPASTAETTADETSAAGADETALAKSRRGWRAWSVPASANVNEDEPSPTASAGLDDAATGAADLRDLVSVDDEEGMSSAVGADGAVLSLAASLEGTAVLAEPQEAAPERVEVREQAEVKGETAAVVDGADALLPTDLPAPAEQRVEPAQVVSEASAPVAPVAADPVPVVTEPPAGEVSAELEVAAALPDATTAEAPAAATATPLPCDAVDANDEIEAAAVPVEPGAGEFPVMAATADESLAVAGIQAQTDAASVAEAPQVQIAPPSGETSLAAEPVDAMVSQEEQTAGAEASESVRVVPAAMVTVVASEPAVAMEAVSVVVMPMESPADEIAEAPGESPQTADATAVAPPTDAVERATDAEPAAQAASVVVLPVADSAAEQQDEQVPAALPEPDAPTDQEAPSAAEMQRDAAPPEAMPTSEVASEAQTAAVPEATAIAEEAPAQSVDEVPTTQSAAVEPPDRAAPPAEITPPVDPFAGWAANQTSFLGGAALSLNDVPLPPELGAVAVGVKGPSVTVTPPPPPPGLGLPVPDPFAAPPPTPAVTGSSGPATKSGADANGIPDGKGAARGAGAGETSARSLRSRPGEGALGGGAGMGGWPFATSSPLASAALPGGDRADATRSGAAAAAPKGEDEAQEVVTDFDGLALESSTETDVFSHLFGARPSPPAKAPMKNPGTGQAQRPSAAPTKPPVPPASSVPATAAPVIATPPAHGDPVTPDRGEGAPSTAVAPAADASPASDEMPVRLDQKSATAPADAAVPDLVDAGDLGPTDDDTLESADDLEKGILLAGWGAAPARRPLGLPSAPVLVLVMLLCMVGAAAAVYALIKVHYTIEGTISFRNYGKLTQREQNEFKKTQHDLLNDGDDHLRAGALLVLPQLHADRDPGFLGDIVQFRTMFSGASVAWQQDKPDATSKSADDADMGRMVVRLTTSDEAGDRARLHAVLAALYHENVRRLGDGEQAGQGVQKLKADIERTQAQIAEQQDRIAQCARKIEQRPPADYIQSLRADATTLQQAHEDALAALGAAKEEVARAQGSTRPALAVALEQAVADDAELRQMQASLQQLTERLNNAKDPAVAQMDDARKALDASLEQFKQQVAAVQGLMKDNPELKTYVTAAQSLQDGTRELTVQLIDDQQEQQRWLSELKRRLDERMEAKRAEVWDKDSQLQDLRQQLDLATRSYNAASQQGGDLAKDAPQWKDQVNQLTQQIDARKAVIGTDAFYADVIAQLQQLIDASQKRLEKNRKDVEAKLAALQADFAKSQPVLDKLPRAQKGIAAELEKRLTAISEARRQYTAAMDAQAAAATSDLQRLGSDVAALQVKIDARKEALSQQLKRQQQARQKEIDAKAVRAAEVESAEQAALATWGKKKQELAEAQERLTSAQAAEEQQRTARAGLLQLQGELEVRNAELDQAKERMGRLVEPQIPEANDLATITSEDRRGLYAVGAVGAVAVLFVVLILLSHAGVLPAVITEEPAAERD